MRDEYESVMKRYSIETANVDYFLENRDIEQGPLDIIEETKRCKKVDEGLPEHLEVREELNSLNLLDKNDGFDGSIYGIDELASTKSNIRLENGDVKLFSLILINCSNLNSGNRLDHYIIHELNHLFESTLCEVYKDGYDVLSGWELIKHNTNAEADEEEQDHKQEKNIFGQYTLFNEIINDMITQEIFGQMRKDNIFILDRPSEEDNFSSSYQNTRFLVEEFYKRYRDKIIESRRDGNIQIILDEVGEENFKALNALFREFKTDDDIYHEVRNPKRKELELERDEILKRMEEYQSQNHPNQVGSINHGK